MVEEIDFLTRGGIYLAKLDPVKINEVGKIRPVVILMAQSILNVKPSTIFVCPLSSQSFPESSDLHVEISVRDKLEIKSYALVDHCRAISKARLIYPRIAQLTDHELRLILHRLQRICGL